MQRVSLGSRRVGGCREPETRDGGWVGDLLVFVQDFYLLLGVFEVVECVYVLAYTSYVEFVQYV